MYRGLKHQLTRRRTGAAVSAALLLSAGVLAGAVTAGPSAAAPPSSGTAPINLVLSPPTTNNTTDLGAPDGAAPAVLAAKGVTPILTTLTVSDLSELNKGTVVLLQAVHVAANGTETAAAGTFSPSSFTVPTRGTSFDLSVTYSTADTNVVLKAVLKKATGTLPGYSASFDVVSTLAFAQADDTTLGTGFGAGSCTSQSKAPVCGFVVLPKGIASAAAALSSGLCADTGCNGADEIQFLAGLGALYEAPAPPATFVLRCDKARCSGKGVSSYTAKIALSNSGAFSDSPACTSKGVLNAGAHFCTDYVSSHRDNAGDLLLEVLFDRDMRSTM